MARKRTNAIKAVVYPAIVALAIIGLVQARSAFGADEQAKPVYVGTETCLGCHESYDAPLKATAHAELFKKAEPGAKNGCEACHGAASGHVDDSTTGVIRFEKAKAGDASEACLKCHTKNKKDWKLSTHSLNGVACTECHSVHGKNLPQTVGKQKKPANLLKVAEPALCYTCHPKKEGEMSLPSHHPVKEGKVKCSDCHSSHDNTAVKMSRAGEVCVKCHQEKAGPFVTQHTPASDNCLTCHTPHGSVNKKMLVLKQPALCIQCHAFYANEKPQFHTTPGQDYKTCTTCHKEVHGSLR